VADFDVGKLHLPSCSRLLSRPSHRLGWIASTHRDDDLGLRACASCLQNIPSSVGEPQRLRLTAAPRRALERLLSAAPGDSEICGLLGGTKPSPREALVTAVIPLPTLTRQRDRFLVGLADYRLGMKCAEQAGLLVVAIYHTHPEPRLQPSLSDRMLLRATAIPQLIFARSGASEIAAACYSPSGSGIAAVEVVADKP
jgi:proteasome lid subunit RPN8/RPN11